MWRSKKFIIVTVLATVALIASIGGVALAQTGSGDENQAKGAMWDKVCAIYQENTGVAINSQELQKAFDQARPEIKQARPEIKNETLDEHLKGLVDEGKITQEQADQYKAWLQAKPDMSQYSQQLKDWQQTRPEVPSALKEWEEARPDIPGLFGGHGGMEWGGGGCFR